jgi:hypothetical protein
MIFLKNRKLIAAEYERSTPLSGGKVELKEGYFGTRRMPGKRRKKPAVRRLGLAC